MNAIQLSEQFSVAGQITTEDLKVIAGQGFKSVINNRPDGEGGPDQPESDDLAAAAEALGLAYLYIPVISGSLTQQNVAEFQQACENLEGPTLLFCRTGARSTMLWNLSGLG
jgi:uncharacterized protein (TIGR01244 family)